jgi:hypothetical protein
MAEESKRDGVNLTAILENLGNFPDYHHERQIVCGEMLVVDPKLVLKLYGMLEKERADVKVRDMEKAGEFIRGELARGKIEPLSGLGFGVLSRSMINVGIWDGCIEGRAEPYVLKNTIYEFDVLPSSIRNFRKLSLEDVGAFCAFELGIVAHEKDAWLRYLRSDRTTQNKIAYLNDVMCDGLALD